MSKQIQSCHPGQSLEQTAQMMWDHDCGCLPVCVGDGAHKIMGSIKNITEREVSNTLATICAPLAGRVSV
ncbi:hypothetical protein [Methylomonas sp. MgM2]